MPTWSFEPNCRKQRAESVIGHCKSLLHWLAVHLWPYAGSGELICAVLRPTDALLLTSAPSATGASTRKFIRNAVRIGLRPSPSSGSAESRELPGAAAKGGAHSPRLLVWLCPVSCARALGGPVREGNQ